MSIEVVEMSTRDADVGRAALDHVYSPEQPIVYSAATGPLAWDLRFATAGEVGADRIRLSGAARAVVPPVGFLLVVGVIQGSQHVVAGREEVHLAPGMVARYPTDVAAVVRWSQFDVMAIRLPLSTVERVAEERLGLSPAELRFDGMLPVSDARRRSWLGLMRFVQHQLAVQDSPAAHPFVAAQLAELVAASALATFPNTSMGRDHLPDPGRVAPAVIRRAVAYIESNGAAPLRTIDVARAAGVGPRALQLAFQRHLGTTPTAYHRRVRLEGAHRDLQAADPGAGDTVAAIAERWGFTKPGRFAAAYRDAYGVSPSHALRT